MPNIFWTHTSRQNSRKADDEKDWADHFALVAVVPGRKMNSQIKAVKVERSSAEIEGYKKSRLGLHFGGKEHLLDGNVVLTHGVSAKPE